MSGQDVFEEGCVFVMDVSVVTGQKNRPFKIVCLVYGSKGKKSNRISGSASSCLYRPWPESIPASQF